MHYHAKITPVIYGVKGLITYKNTIFIDHNLCAGVAREVINRENVQKCGLIDKWLMALLGGNIIIRRCKEYLVLW